MSVGAPPPLRLARAGASAHNVVLMRNYECPNCGAPVSFLSSIAPHAVCGHCRSLVVRDDFKIETLGKVAELPPDLSPLQIGTRGEWEGKGFTLIGRVRYAWEQGSWTEWCALFEGKHLGWVGESQGFYTVTFEVTPTPDLPRPGSFAAGVSLQIKQEMWRVVDMKTASCLGGEGELPFAPLPGTQRESADLSRDGDKFATIEYEDGGVRFYAGGAALFDDLKFANTRDVPGWTPGVTAPIRKDADALGCPNCGAPVELRAAGLSMTTVCGSCGSLMDTSKPQVALVEKAAVIVAELAPELTIGTFGELRGEKWQIIGYVVRKDEYAPWEEYLLFNPWQGFAWLVTYKHHWSFVTRRFSDLPANLTQVDDEHGRHKLFARGQATVVAVLGEFYWQVRCGERAVTEDFICPPYIISRETYPDLTEFTWSGGEYLSHDEVARVFSVKLGEPAGIYLNQPNPYAERAGRVALLGLLGALLYVAIQAVSLMSAPENLAFTLPYTYSGTNAPPVVSPTFEVKGRPQPVHVTAAAPVDNAWIEFDLELVNQKTEQKFPASLGVSYYHGYDDGQWTEGSQKSTVDIPAIPPGTYRLIVEADDAAPGFTRLPVQFTVRTGGVFWVNFWGGLALIVVYPLWTVWRRHAFERQRWYDSDFDPYARGDSDDDDE